MIAFQHQSDVKRIIMDEFDMPTAVKILREAQREANEIAEEAWNYASLVRRAEKVLIYGSEAEELEED